MKPIGIWERLAMVEAQNAQLARLITDQTAAMEALTGRITALQVALSAPRAVAIMPEAEAVPLSVALRGMMQIATNTAAANMLTVEKIRGRSRLQSVVWPRQDAMLAQREAGHSLASIGRFWRRDHTTVMHGINAAKARENARNQAVNACDGGRFVAQKERAEGVFPHPHGPDHHRTVGGFQMTANASQYSDSTVRGKCEQSPNGGAV